MILAAAGLLAACGNDAEPEVRQVEQNEQAEPAVAEVDDGYPIDVCVVSDQRLGSMGEPHVVEHEGRTVKFCCEPCTDDFYEDPDAYLAKLD